MKVIKTKLQDCFIIEPKVFGDQRGFFMETFQSKRYEELVNIKDNFVQDNYSRSSKGVLRGLHYQKNNPQGKLVRVVRGEVFDVAVDLRKDSLSYKQWESVILSEENKKQFWIPPGFAHGFLTTSKNSELVYKNTEFWSKENEYSINWKDPKIAIKWPQLTNPFVLSKKDEKALCSDNIENSIFF